MKQSYIFEYQNENDFRKKERTVRKYNMLAYKKLTFEYYPKDAPVLEGVDISSGSEYILSVNEENVITALAPGQTYLVVCSVYADIEVSYNVVISEKHFLPESVTVTGSETEILVGQSLTVSATVLPERAADDVVWSSSDPSIATVDENGVVTGVKAGTVKIIATTPEVETARLVTGLTACALIVNSCVVFVNV